MPMPNVLKYLEKWVGFMSETKAGALFNGIADIYVIAIFIVGAICITPCIVYQIKTHTVRFLPEYSDIQAARQREHLRDIEMNYVTVDAHEKGNIMSRQHSAEVSGRRNSFPRHHVSRHNPHHHGGFGIKAEYVQRELPDHDLQKVYPDEFSHGHQAVMPRQRRRSFGDRHDYHNHPSSTVAYHHMINKTWR